MDGRANLAQGPRATGDVTESGVQGSTDHQPVLGLRDADRAGVRRPSDHGGKAWQPSALVEARFIFLLLGLLLKPPLPRFLRPQRRQQGLNLLVHNMHPDVAGELAPAEGATCLPIQAACQTSPAECVTAVRRDRRGHKAEADRTLRGSFESGVVNCRTEGGGDSLRSCGPRPDKRTPGWQRQSGQCTAHCRRALGGACGPSCGLRTQGLVALYQGGLDIGLLPQATQATSA
mmetsp:Transcript_60841/g.174442  ORF Transcript_60841/g.174442 Transcript_60841/m.174442 type:complete len:232 (-) Transcript_60841:1362-2057(-)